MRVAASAFCFSAFDRAPSHPASVRYSFEVVHRCSSERTNRTRIQSIENPKMVTIQWSLDSLAYNTRRRAAFVLRLSPRGGGANRLRSSS